MKEPDLRVRLGRLELANPVLVAAGTFGYGIEFERAVRLEALGGIITKTITLAPRQGNSPPRLADTPSGMLNSVGLQNVGLEAFLRDKLPRLAQAKAPVIVSVLGESLDEVRTLCAALNEQPAVAAIELNLSCPNLKQIAECGLRNADWENQQSEIRNPKSEIPRMVAQDSDETFAMVQAARAVTTKPLIAKLSPDVTDLRPVAQAAERAGAEALSLCNTFTGMSLDPDTRRSRLGALTGGLSGPAIRPLAVWRVWLVRQVVRCPLIGLGGILRGEDALEFLIAGASAVAVGTANFADPRAALRVLGGVRRHLQRHGLGSVQELVGTLQTA
ncbi:MAG: dihydroorotate dehydrogenase [Candidatus Omnitrophica bacterium]|nr:dihydroorotate dehydrogenase [Candidatus Omnitrophota bacterium]